MTEVRGGTDWRRRFDAPSILFANFADGDRAVVVSCQDGETYQLYAWDLAADRLTQLTSNADGVVGGCIDPSGRFVYYLRDVGGTEQGHMVRVPFGGGEPLDLTPDVPDYTLRGVGFSASGTFGIKAVNRDGYHLFVVDGATTAQPAAPRLIQHDVPETWGALLSHDGELAASWSTARAGVRFYTLIVTDVRTGERVAELDDGRQASVIGTMFSPLAGDSRLLAQTSRSGWIRPVIWDPRTGERRDVDPPGIEGELEPLDWSADGRRLLLCHHKGEQRLHVYDLETGELTALDHPSGTYVLPYIDGAVFGGPDTVVGVRGTSTGSPAVVELDARTGHQTRVLREPAAAPPGRQWQSVTFPSSDGVPVQAWYATPDGEGPFPAILDVHGGPHWVIPEGFDPVAQAWLDHGYAWMTVNFRGSLQFGRDFMAQIWGNIGHWELEDMVAARTWMVDQGIARPDEVFVTGASYGGYLTLWALGRRPDLWVGGMGLVVEADLASSYHECGEALRNALHGWMRGSPEERPEAYRTSSPITYVPNVGAPLHVVQGRNDTRTPPKQFENYEARMRRAGKDIEVEWYDAGHESLGPKLMIWVTERQLEFAERVLAAHRSRGGA